MRTEVPIVIAGGGPVGLTLALALARAGLQPLVLERKDALDRHSRATLLVPRSLEILEGLGVLPAFLAQGERNDAIRIFTAPGRKRLLAFDFAALADRTTTPFSLALAQDRTEAILLDAVREAGVTVAFGTAFERFEEGDAGLLVHASDGRVFDAAYLVGADGAHSAVRAQLGWELEGRTYSTRAYLADVRVAPEADFDGGWLADPTAPSFTIAVRFADGVWRLIESAIGDEVGEAELAPRAERLTGRLFGAGAWRETLWTAAYRKHERRAAQFRRGRIVLAGDAAHLNSPAGGQGMNAGLGDAAALVGALIGALAHPAEADMLLDRYEAQRIAFFDRRVRALTNGIERMETAPAWLRNLAFSVIGLARFAGLETFIARRLSMLDDAGGATASRSVPGPA